MIKIKFWKITLLIWWSFIFFPIGALLSNNNPILTAIMFVFALIYPCFALILIIKLSLLNKIKIIS